MRARPLSAALLAVLAAGCQTEARESGRDPADAAARGGWNVGGGSSGGDSPHDPYFDPPRRGPDEVVEVPVEAYAPLDAFFDNEGYLLGDIVEIDCSYEPFMARMVGLAYDRFGMDFVVREEGRVGDVYQVTLRNVAEGAAYQENLVPKATFGSQRRGTAATDPATGRTVPVAPRPVFEFVGTREVRIRMHMTSDPACPVWFRARAIGTPSPLRPDVPRNAVYMNANRGRRARGTELRLSLEVRRGADGKWTTPVADGADPAPAGAGGR